MTSASIAQRITDLRGRLSRLPRVNLAALPTPLDECSRLANEYEGARIFIKRDDLTGLAFGGNKVRQHEYVLAEAVAQGADCIVQGSASQSNHSRQLAAAGAKLGLEVHLTPLQDEHSDPVQGNYLIDHLLGAQIHPVALGDSIIEAKKSLANELRARGKNPYVVGMGAQDALELAAVAYVDAVMEIVEQLPGELLPDYIVTTSQGSTQAGVLLACEQLGLHSRVLGVGPLDATHEAYISPEGILELVQAVARRLGVNTFITLSEIRHDTNFVEPGYGVPSADGLAALKKLGAAEGILLDPVYSSKGFAGLLHYLTAGEIETPATVVFIHTGGLPALFEYAQALVDEGLNEMDAK